jgi:hypothetical protein
MATYRAIAAVTSSLQGLLHDARPADLSNVEIAAFEVTDYHKPTPIEDGISILLYRVNVGSMPRALSGRPTADGQRRLPSLPVDLYYLFTPWARTTTVQHLLLGWMMRTLEDASIINSSVLNHYGGPDAVFDDGENVCLIAEPLALQDLANLWDSLKPNPHVSVAYVARLVHLDSTLQHRESLIQTRELDYTQAPG